MASVDQPQVQPPYSHGCRGSEFPREPECVIPVAILTFQLASYGDESRLCKKGLTNPPRTEQMATPCGLGAVPPL
jgi:hypothetical protein